MLVLGLDMGIGFIPVDTEITICPSTLAVTDWTMFSSVSQALSSILRNSNLTDRGGGGCCQ
jgi:hypothetical protein